MFAEIKARLGLDISAFKSGMDQAKRQVSDTGTAIQTLQSKLLGPIGAVIALTAGLRASFERARSLREEAEELGFTLDENTARVARMGDAFDTVLSKLRSGANRVLGGLQGMAENIGTEFAYLSARLEQPGLTRDEFDRRVAIANAFQSLGYGSEEERRQAKAAARRKELQDQLDAFRAANEAHKRAREEAARLEEERLKKLEEQAEVVERIAETQDVDLLAGERARLRVLQEQRMELEAQADAKADELHLLQQELELAGRRAVNPMGISVQELAGMDPNDSRFGFSLKARRRIEAARESISLAQQARFAEIGGDTRLADRLSGESASLEQTALSFRSPGRNSEVAQISREVKNIARDITSINKSLALLEVED